MKPSTGISQEYRGAFIRLRKKRAGFIVSIAPAEGQRFFAATTLVGAYPAKDKAYEAAKMVIDRRLDGNAAAERLCSPGDIDRVRRELKLNRGAR